MGDWAHRILVLWNNAGRLWTVNTGWLLHEFCNCLILDLEHILETLGTKWQYTQSITEHRAQTHLDLWAIYNSQSVYWNVLSSRRTKNQGEKQTGLNRSKCLWLEGFCWNRGKLIRTCRSLQASMSCLHSDRRSERTSKDDLMVQLEALKLRFPHITHGNM